MQTKPSIQESMALGVLALSPVPMSSAELAANFGVDPNRVSKIFEGLASKGYVDHLGDGYHVLTSDGEQRVELRGDW